MLSNLVPNCHPCTSETFENLGHQIPNRIMEATMLRVAAVVVISSRDLQRYDGKTLGSHIRKDRRDKSREEG